MTTMPAASEAAAAPVDLPQLDVEDTTALVDQPDRVHEMMVDGKRTAFTFKSGEKKRLPFDVAIRFNLPGFIVTDPRTGSRYEPPPEAPESGAVQQLKPGEVVARLDELTIDALLIRVKVLPGGDKFSRTHGKEALAAFIANHNTKKLVPQTNPNRAPDAIDRIDGAGTKHIAGALDAKQLNKMFGDVE